MIDAKDIEQGHEEEFMRVIPGLALVFTLMASDVHAQELAIASP